MGSEQCNLHYKRYVYEHHDWNNKWLSRYCKIGIDDKYKFKYKYVSDIMQQLHMGSEQCKIHYKRYVYEYHNRRKWLSRYREIGIDNQQQRKYKYASDSL